MAARGFSKKIFINIHGASYYHKSGTQTNSKLKINPNPQYIKKITGIQQNSPLPFLPK